MNREEFFFRKLMPLVNRRVRARLAFDTSGWSSSMWRYEFVILRATFNDGAPTIHFIWKGIDVNDRWRETAEALRSYTVEGLND